MRSWRSSRRSDPAAVRGLGMLCAGMILIGLPLAAEPMSRGYFHGEIVASQGAEDLGEVTAKDAGGSEFTCTYDNKSLFQYRRQRIAAKKVFEGDPVDILVDRTSQHPCYVRILTVIAPEPEVSLLGAKVEGLRATPRPTVTSGVTFAQVQARRNETISGVVTGIENGLLHVRTRDGDRQVRITRSTRYLQSGRRLNSDALAVNQRVSVDVGRDADDRPLALQVSWGTILQVP